MQAISTYTLLSNQPQIWISTESITVIYLCGKIKLMEILITYALNMVHEGYRVNQLHVIKLEEEEGFTTLVFQQSVINASPLGYMRDV